MEDPFRGPGGLAIWDSYLLLTFWIKDLAETPRMLFYISNRSLSLFICVVTKDTTKGDMEQINKRLQISVAKGDRHETPGAVLRNCKGVWEESG